MKMRASKVKWQEFQWQNKHRQLAQLESMINEFEQMIKELEQQIAEVVAKEGAHFSASTMVQAARQRRSNLIASVDNLKKQYEAAQAEIAEFEALQYPILARHSPVMNRRETSSARQIMV